MPNPILENIRLALGRSTSNAGGMNPEAVAARPGGSPDEEIDQFLREIKKLSGIGARLKVADVEGALKVLISEHGVRKATLWDTPRLKQLHITETLRALQVDVIPSNSTKEILAECDLGVTEVDYILPETGTVGLLSSARKPRAVSLLPRIHLAIATPASLRADMHEVFAEAKNSRYLVLITGPSRTADIELTTTLGVHGPKNLYVWILGEEIIN